MAENEATLTTEAKPSLDKKALIADALLLASILSGFFLISLTWKAGLFDSLLGLNLDHHGEVIKIMLIYLLFVLLVKIGIFLSKITEFNDAIGTSLLIVMIIATLTAYAYAAGVQNKAPIVGVRQASHIAVWILIAQISKVLCAAIEARFVGLNFWSVFGWTIEITVGILAVGSIVGANPFKLL